MTYTESYRLSQKQWLILGGLFLIVIGVLFLLRPSSSVGAIILAGIVVFLLLLKNQYFQTASLEIETNTIRIKDKKKTEEFSLQDISELSYARYHDGFRHAPFIVKLERPTYNSPQKGMENFDMNSQLLEIKPWVPALLTFIPFGVLITWKDKTQKTFIPSAHPEQLMQALKKR